VTPHHTSLEFDPLDRIREATMTVTDQMLDEECDFEVNRETGDIIVTRYDMASEEGAVLARYLVRLNGAKVVELPADEKGGR